MTVIQRTFGLMGQNGVTPRRVQMVVTDSLAAVTTTGFLNQEALLPDVLFATDIIDMIYSYSTAAGTGTYGQFQGTVNMQTGQITLTQLESSLVWHDLVIGQAALAGATHAIIQPGVPGAQFYVRDIRVNYLSAGLSGNSGNRLLTITDGTTSFNNAGITAALLGTPINTLWGGTGNPLPGTVAMNTLSAAGLPIYAVYTGGSADYNAGNVSISVLTEQFA